MRAAFTAPLRPPSVTVLFGPSGAGKTTVLRAVAGLDRPDAGHVRFAGEPWFDAAAGIDQPPRRRGAGVVFQEPALFPHLSVEANVGYGLFRLPRAARAARIREAAGRVGVEALLARRPAALSGGQRQRVALARALAPSPRLLLLDEPLASLDAPSREELRRDLRGVLASAGIPALLVTHDREEALALGDWLVVLAEGGVRQAGPVDEVFSRPADALVARAVGAENVLAAEVRGEDGGLVTVAVGGALLTAVRGAEADDPRAGAGLHPCRGGHARAGRGGAHLGPESPRGARPGARAARTAGARHPRVRLSAGGAGDAAQRGGARARARPGGAGAGEGACGASHPSRLTK